MTVLTWPENSAAATAPLPPRTPLPYPWPQSRKGIPVEECGEPLAEIPDYISWIPVYYDRSLPGATNVARARRSVVDRLIRAHALLPDGFSFAVLDAWRPLSLQRALVELYSTTHGDVVGSGFVSAPDDRSAPPPHVSGAALDLTISYDGVPLGLGSDFDEFTPQAASDWYDKQPSTDPVDLQIDRLRGVMRHALLSAGFAPYREEWWHWSYGDQWWAAYYQRPAAIFDVVEG